MMSLWDALRMNMMISYQELVRTFLKPAGHYITCVTNIGIRACWIERICCRVAINPEEIIYI